jgi:probable HAF family extracellular repeat protein
MRRMVILAVASLFLASVLSGAAGSARSVGSRWVLRDLGVSGTPIALNDRGQIVVHAAASDTAFLWESGRVIGLGTLGGKTTDANAINERGQVVGWSRAKDGSSHAFLWQNGRMTDLGTLGGKESEAIAINERGQVVGVSATSRKDQLGRPVRHAFLWQAGKITDLNPPGPFRSRAVAINESGQVLIQTFRESNCDDSTQCGDTTPTDERAWLWAGGKFTKLGTVGGSSATAVALNDSGQAIGRSGDHAVLWENGVMTDLGALPHFAAAYWPHDINNQGQVVGYAWHRDYEPGRQDHAWVWENGKMSDLGTHLVTDINERSQIVGNAKTGQFHVVLWTLRSR